MLDVCLQPFALERWLSAVIVWRIVEWWDYILNAPLCFDEWRRVGIVEVPDEIGALLEKKYLKTLWTVSLPLLVRASKQARACRDAFPI